MVHFSTRAAWEHQVQKWNGSAWQFMAGYEPGDTTGVMPNVYTENGLAAGTTYSYAVAAKGSGQWTPFGIVDVPSWTTDLWNASAEHQGTWFWASSGAASLGNSTQHSDGIQSLQLTSNSGTVSAYQDLAFHQTVCPSVDVRRDIGAGPASVQLAIWGLGPTNDPIITDPFVIPDNGVFQRLWFGGTPGCRTFGLTYYTSLRFEVYLESAGSIQIDRARLVYDGNTFGTP